MQLRMAVLTVWVLFVGVLWGQTTTFQPNDGNVRLINDVFVSTDSISFVGMALATGDFNGDGHPDVAVAMKPYAGRRTIDVLWGPFEPDGYWSAHKKYSVQYGVSKQFIFSPQWAPTLALADLDGDGRDDLIVGRKDDVSGFSQVDIVFGSEEQGTWDLDTQVPPCRITGVSVAAAGDFNGDQWPDLVVCEPATAVCYVRLGQVGAFSGTVAIGSASSFYRLPLSKDLPVPFWGDLNGDGASDLVFSVPKIGVNGLGNEVNIFWGNTSLPLSAGGATWPAGVRLVGKTNAYLRALGIGDVTGDGHDDLFVGTSTNGCIIDGSDLLSGQPVLLQQEGQPNSVVFHSFGQVDVAVDGALLSTDFDGDGAPDFFPILQNGRTSGFLTSDTQPGGITLDALGAPSLEWVGNYRDRIGTADFNHDGFGDLVVYEDFGSVYPPYGALRVLWGYRPLRNSHITVVLGPSGSSRATASVKVDGQPVSMLLSGDITDNFKNTWIPFQSVHAVTLSPEQGTKTVSVTFRNVQGRTSEPAQATLTIGSVTPRVVTDTNRLRPGGSVVFDCHVAVPGLLRGQVWGPNGTLVRELKNETVEPGIYPLVWDGRSESGAVTARGVYFLRIETNGDHIQKEILVE